MTLHAHRVYSSNGPQPITVADIGALAQIERYDAAESRWLLEILTKLDTVFLEESYKKLQKEQEKSRRKNDVRSRGRG